jgi:hypothetical protein
MLDIPPSGALDLAWRVSSGWNKARHPLPCGRSSAMLLACASSSRHFSSYRDVSRSDEPSWCPAGSTGTPPTPDARPGLVSLAPTSRYQAWPLTFSQRLSGEHLVLE